ncbi:hypothetical protein BIV59_13530 [Bacillus sp. MUM 13]|nr:hypothetical protein BIV59_13530 [Bacillus sp. MUM 13]
MHIKNVFSFIFHTIPPNWHLSPVSNRMPKKFIIDYFTKNTSPLHNLNRNFPDCDMWLRQTATVKEEQPPSIVQGILPVRFRRMVSCPSLQQTLYQLSREPKIKSLL